MNVLWVIVAILLIAALIGGVGPWAPGGYGYSFGHGGIGVIGLLLIVLIVLLVMGRL